MNDYFASLIDHCAAEWRPVVGHEDSHEVSSGGMVRSVKRTIYFSDGRVRVFPQKMICGSFGSHGYRGVSIGKNRKQVTTLVHRIVADAFIGPANGMQVDHIDFNKKNNRVSNLRYLSPDQNSRHRNAADSPYMGVRKNKHGWQAFIQRKGLPFMSKMFKSRDDAVVWRLKMEASHYDGFAPVRAK